MITTPKIREIEMHESRLVVRKEVQHTVRRRFTVDNKHVMLVTDYPFNKCCQYSIVDENEKVIYDPELLKELKRLAW
jgi:hypothetical protein